jgi:FkbM family methyltransferase
MRKRRRFSKPRFYSQNGEDCLLWRFFDDTAHGYFVDIGAFDGIHLSNTYAFERMGWRGICVEAHPDYFPLLKRNRPRSLCLHYACVEERDRGHVEFQVEEMGLLSSLLADEGYFEDVKARYAKRGLPFKGFRTVRIPAATLDEILDRHHRRGPPLDLISIDVEGTEIGVLKGFDSVRHAPRVMVVEANSEKARAGILALLVRKRGYEFAGRLVENLFFVRDRRDLSRIRGIEIDCRIEKQTHPLGDAFSTDEYLRGKVIDRNRWNSLEW